jgi:hypothetical protein
MYASAQLAPPRLLHSHAGVDTLLLFTGSVQYGQLLLLTRQVAQARRVLRRLVGIGPRMLRDTRSSWGYSPTFCRLEQLWLETYGSCVAAIAAEVEGLHSPGVDSPSQMQASVTPDSHHELDACISSQSEGRGGGAAAARALAASHRAKSSSLREEGLAMAHALDALLANRLQFRLLRHANAAAALRLAADSARAALMLGEAIHEQPLPGQTPAHAEAALRRALALQKTEINAAKRASESRGARPNAGAHADATTRPAGATAAPADAMLGRAAAGCEEVLPGGTATVQPQYWHTLARAVEEARGREGAPEAAAVLRDGITWAPQAVELYMSLGAIHETALQFKAALRVYASFPSACQLESDAGAEAAATGDAPCCAESCAATQPPTPSFEQAVIASSAASLIIERMLDYHHPMLVDALVTLGRRLGVLNIETYVDALDQADAVGVIRQVYDRIQGGAVDQTAFFALRGWDYERSATRRRAAASDEVGWSSQRGAAACT